MRQSDIEKKILAFWQQDNTFRKSVEKKAPQGDYVFYDGPPFATGTPHYGHIVASLIKDMVPRYWTMRGYRVERRWGWDCHGLPIENIVEKEHGFKHKKDILAYGVDKFNEDARSKVLLYVKEWREVIDRLGRWVDFDNDYKTMDMEFMESVWWVFKQLYDKGLLYEAYRSLHICPRCETTLAQSEVAQGYKEVTDLSVVVKFRISNNQNVYLLAWTTTPWTLPGNAALAVGEDIEYVIVKAKEALAMGSFSGLDPLVQEDSVSDKNLSTINGFVNRSNVENKSRPKNGPEGNRTPQGGIPSPLSAPATGPGSSDRQNELYHEYLILAKTIFEKWIAENKVEGEVVGTFKGKDLLGLEYEPLFPYYDSAFKVYAADFVSTEEGTGIVHIAPAFGEDDMELGKRENLPFIQHVNMDGTLDLPVKNFQIPISNFQTNSKRVEEILKKLQGMSVKHQDEPDTEDHPETEPESVDVLIVQYLAARGLLFSKEKHKHSYPHCWRCDSPLLNYATSSWFVAVEKIKKDLLKNGAKIEWMPEHIKEGRFGQWLKGARDWSISRQRFWGSVIPVWRCQKSPLLSEEGVGGGARGQGCNNIVVIGSIAELEKLSGQKVKDLHKHFVDKITFPCKKCGGTMKRIEDVLDCWFESGSMPYTQAHFPAEFIAEGVDQTRAWFYYLHVLATAIKKKPAFKHVVVNGIVLAEDGKKMSKRLQNYPDPMDMFAKYGADAVRYYLASSPVMVAEDFNFSEKGVEEVVKKVLLILYNVLSFYKLYASEEVSSFKFQVSRNSNILDRWIVSKTNELVGAVNASYQAYNLNHATRPIADFINELSTWYLRRSRDRFKGDDQKDKQAALFTLRWVLENLAKAMAPVMPFTAEHIWQELGNKESVHLQKWPIDEDREEWERMVEVVDVVEPMAKVRLIVESGLAARANAGIKVRQPLAKITVNSPKISNDFVKLIKDELNVKEVIFSDSGDGTVVLDTLITPELRLDGHLRELIRVVNARRKEAGLTPGDVITLTYQTDSEELKKVFGQYGEAIKKAVIASEIREGSGGEERQVNGEKVRIKISN